MSDEIKIDDPRLVDAKIALLNAQTQGQILDNLLADSLAETAKIATERESLKYKWEKSAAQNSRIFYLTGSIDEKYTASTIDVLSRWDRIDTQAGDIDSMYTLVMCSPGGDVISGFQLYSFLKGLSTRRPLRISAAGLCASMATIVHQAASEGLRIIEPGTSYLLHKVSGGAGGRWDTVKDTTDWMGQINERMIRILAERGHKSFEEIDAEIDRREMFIAPEDVVDVWGLADKMEHVS